MSHKILMTSGPVGKEHASKTKTLEVSFWVTRMVVAA